MSCDAFEARVPDFVTDRLEPEEADRVRHHLEACPQCRAYRDLVVELYGLTLEREQPPAELRSLQLREPPGLDAGRRVPLGRMLLAVAAALLLWWWLAREGEPDLRRVPPAMVALERIELDVPSVPDTTVTAGWFEDPRRARRLAAYVGKPLLVVYSYSHCPLCRAMDQRLQTERGAELVGEFIACYVRFDGDLPLPLRRHRPPEPWQFRMPAVWIGAAGGESQARFEVRGLNQVAAQVTRWWSEHPGLPAPLAGGELAICREVFAAIPSLLARFEYRELLASLERVIALGPSERSRFIADAGDLRDALLAKLGAQIDELAGQIAGGGPAREIARGRARRLHAELAATPLGAQLETIIGAGVK